MVFDFYMHVPQESMLKDALLKAEIPFNAKYCHGLLSFFKIESLSADSVHNSRNSVCVGEEERKKKKFYPQLECT